MRHSTQLTLLLLIAVLAGFSSNKAQAQPTLPSVEVPPGIPLTTTHKHQCITQAEWDQYYAYIDSQRVPLPGCKKGVVRPQKVVQGYKRGVYGNVQSCLLTRKDAFSAAYLDVFVKEVVELSDADETGKNALCAANMLFYWAQNGAMTEIGTDGPTAASEMTRVWTLAGLSTAYFKSNDLQKQAKAQLGGYIFTKHEAIMKWMKTLSHQIKYEIAIDKDTAEVNDSSLTNRYFWRGYSILPTALMLRDKVLLKTSERVFTAAMHEVTEGRGMDNGFMPAETARRAKALTYHGFALQPVIGMALLSKSYNCEFSATPWRKQKLKYALRKTIEGELNRDIFEAEVLRQTGRAVSIGPSSTARNLLFLANEIDPNIVKNTTEFLLSQNAIGADHSLLLKNYGPNKNQLYGADTSFDRLGGSYYQTAMKVRRLSKKMTCPLDIPKF